MERILTDNVWKQIASLARACKRRSAALAYVSTDNYVSFKKGDILVCDASDAAIKSGETSAAILARYYKKGVQLYSRTSLHAKVLVMGSEGYPWLIQPLSILSPQFARSDPSDFATNSRITSESICSLG